MTFFQSNIYTETLEGQTTYSLEPGQDATPPCPLTDPPSISGQDMDFQRQPECMHLSAESRLKDRFSLFLIRFNWMITYIMQL